MFSAPFSSDVMFPEPLRLLPTLILPKCLYHRVDPSTALKNTVDSLKRKGWARHHVPKPSLGYLICNPLGIWLLTLAGFRGPCPAFLGPLASNGEFSMGWWHPQVPGPTLVGNLLQPRKGAMVVRERWVASSMYHLSTYRYLQNTLPGPLHPYHLNSVNCLCDCSQPW